MSETEDVLEPIEPELTLQEQVIAELESENNQLRHQLRRVTLERDTLVNQGNLRETFWQEAIEKVNRANEERDNQAQEVETFVNVLDDINLEITKSPVKTDRIKNIVNEALEGRQ